MSKDDTTILKGIAILMMLWLHLFISPDAAKSYTSLFCVGSLPLANVFARVCNPVDFFLICSGYGFAYIYHRNRLNEGKQMKKVIRLYLNYWLILLIFIGIGSLMKPEKYPGSLTTIIENFSGWNPMAYDHPAWFLLPYCLLSLSAIFIFKCIDRLGLIKALVLSFALTYAAMAITHFYIVPNRLHHEWFAIIITYFSLLFAFVFGACLNYKFEKGAIITPALKNNQWLTRFLLLLWLGIHMLTDSSALAPIFEIAFLILFINLNITGFIRRVLLELGKKSMPMWLTHAFFYQYLFHDFIYGFKYPIIIFLVLVLISYLTAIAIQQISRITINRIPILNK